MIEFIQQCYEASIDTSEDGYGGYKQIGYFINHTDARDAVRGKSSWGRDGSVTPVKLHIKVYENLEEYDAGARDKMKQAALGKLTKREKELLGIKDGE